MLLSHSAPLRVHIELALFLQIAEIATVLCLVARDLLTLQEWYCVEANIVTRVSGNMTTFVRTTNSYCNAI